MFFICCMENHNLFVYIFYKPVNYKMNECKIKKRKKEGNEIKNKRDCRRKKKRRDKYRGEYKKKKWKKQQKNKEIIISYTKTEREINRIKEDRWNRRKVKKRKISTVICSLRKFCWTY